MQFQGVQDKEFQDLIETYHNQFMFNIQDFIRDYYPEHLHNILTNPPTVELSNRLATRAGSANTKTKVIKLNYRLHKLHPEQLRDTYGHELAHIVSKVLTPNCSSHGREWRHIMKHFGLTSERCHNMNVSGLKRQVKRYIYTCSCKEYMLTTRKHERQNRYDYPVFSCRKCYKGLVYKDGPITINGV